MEQLHDIISNTLFSVHPIWRDVIIFIVSYLEGLPVVGSILPGGTVALVVGSLTREGFMKPLIAVNIIAIASFLGDITGFYVGPKLLTLSWFKKFVQKEEHQKHWDLFDRHIALVIIFGKLLPVVRSTPSLFAGARNIPKLRYFLYVFLGSYLWSFVGIYGGNILARALGKAAIPAIIGVFIVTGIGVYIWSKFKNKK